jgi:hypothetical protein
MDHEMEQRKKRQEERQQQLADAGLAALGKFLDAKTRGTFTYHLDRYGDLQVMVRYDDGAAGWQSVDISGTNLATGEYAIQANAK